MTARVMTCAYCGACHPWLGRDHRYWWPTTTYAQCWSCTIEQADRRARPEPWWWRFLARRVRIAW